jgi:hypothetical protein
MLIRKKPKRLPLAAEIALALSLKILILWGLWTHFFAHPQAPHMQMNTQQVEQHLLPATAPPATLISPSEKPHADH